MMYNYKINSNVLVISAIIFTLVVIPLLSYTSFAAAPIEQFVYQGLLKDGSSNLIDGQKDIFFLFTMGMDQASHNFFASATFSSEKDGGVGRSHFFDQP